MKITLLGEERIRLETTPGALTVEAESPEAAYSPYQMLASGLATCTFSVLDSWGRQANLSAEDLVIEVAWSFADEPHRVARYDQTFRWPSLPEARRKAALRAAKLCPVHATLSQSPEIEMEFAE